MKTKIILMLLAVFTVTGNLSAQSQGKKQRPDRAKIEAMQCNQVVQALMLDDATAAKFTPVYKQYLAEMRAIRGTNLHKSKMNSPTDADVENAIKNRFAQSHKMLDIREKYYDEFRKVLSSKQIMRMYNVEKGNARKYQKEWNKRQEKHRDGKKGEKRPESVNTK